MLLNEVNRIKSQAVDWTDHNMPPLVSMNTQVCFCKFSKSTRTTNHSINEYVVWNNQEQLRLCWECLKNIKRICWTY